MNIAFLSLFLGLSAVSSADEDRDLRVMTFNIRYGSADDGENAWDKRKDFLIQTIRAFNPDLLGTQETLANQRDAIAAGLSGYGVLAAGRDDGRERGEMMALFYRESRFEKLDGGHFWLSETPDVVGSKSWDSSLPRMVTWVKLRDRRNSEAPPIVHFNTHFDHRGPRARLESASLIRRKIEAMAVGCRVVITGDFNADAESPPYQALFHPEAAGSRTLRDAFRVANPVKWSFEGTFTNFRASVTRGGRIDWIGVSEDWEVRSAAIDRTSKNGLTPSDHYPVIAILRPAAVSASPPQSQPKPQAEPKGESAKAITLRVLSYNIHHGEGLDGKVDLPRLAKVIQGAKPDFVALQEVDRNCRRSGSVDQTAELARLTGMQGAFGKAIDYDGGEYGQAILSRFPIAKTEVHLLPGVPDRERRIAFEAQIAIDGRGVSFVTTHLHHQNPQFREQQAEEINKLFGSLDRLAVLAGDLNATPTSKPLEILGRRWTLGTTDASMTTFPAGKPDRKIDFVLHRGLDGLRTIEETVLDEPEASDHRPILVVLKQGN